MVEALASKTMAWEKERGAEFLYDGVSPEFISLTHHASLLRINLFLPLSRFAFFPCLKSTPYYARRKRKKDGGSGYESVNSQSV